MRKRLEKLVACLLVHTSYVHLRHFTTRQKLVTQLEWQILPNSICWRCIMTTQKGLKVCTKCNMRYIICLYF